jgi:hypothetical protein
MSRTRTLLGLIVSLLLACSQRASAYDASRRVVFFLDCSQAMSTPLVAAADSGDADNAACPTRMSAAKEALKAMLTRLTAAASYQAGVWLYGHRLAWGEGEQPELLDQSEYLAQTLGFSVLRDLLPGDDVELVRPLSTLQAPSLPAFFVRLDSVKAWGEAPLYLALARGFDNLGRESTGANTTFVVITSGANVQGLCKFRTTKAQVLKPAEKTGIPIHFVLVGKSDNPNLQAEAELEQIASATRGTMTRAATASELLAQLDQAIKTHRAPAAQQAAAPDPRAGTTVTTVADSPARPRTRTIEGQIVFYDRPVAGAQVTLDGSSVPSTISDAGGRFTFTNVPEGDYRLAYSAIVKNIIRKGAKPLRVETKTDEPLALRLVLE